MKIGDRVIINDKDIGHIESIEHEHMYVDVRLLTPNNTPSALVTSAPIECVEKIPENIIPLPKSEEWWKEARSFCAAIESTCEEVTDHKIIPFRKMNDKSK